MRGRHRIAAAVALLLFAVGLATWRADLADRLRHPQRYAVSGRALLSADRYVGVARGAMGRDERVAALAYPDGSGPVVVSIVSRTGEARRRAFLDPPTARMLAVEPGNGVAASQPPLARPAQPVAGVIARARSIDGGEVRAVEWPTRRRPDWTVCFDGPAARCVKVADDSRSARAVFARGQDGIAAALGGGAWTIAAAVLAIVGAVLLVRRGRAVRRRAPRP